MCVRPPFSLLHSTIVGTATGLFALSLSLSVSFSFLFLNFEKLFKKRNEKMFALLFFVVFQKSSFISSFFFIVYSV